MNLKAEKRPQECTTPTSETHLYASTTLGGISSGSFRAAPHRRESIKS